MDTTDTGLAALDSRNTMVDHISRVANVHPQTITDVANLQKEIGTKAYILDRLFSLIILSPQPSLPISSPS